ncbi:MAG TPA: 2-oxoglutarate dehydrogenase complex dihydrolipoyllysine-residue succinyltransferase, partial [Hyphomicrobium sp.]|nr:2-oxoglutarate dehydrogenase complex dihydrolipoyllysine-residue succinyltransferase [Hyphomicrobium sp.]
GEVVKADEPLVELETDKVTVEVPAPAAGVLGDILAMQGATVAIGSLLAALNEGGGVSVAAPAPAAAPPPKEAPAKPASAAKPAPAKSTSTASAPPPAPAARKVLAEAQIDPDAVAGSGRRGQVLKEDALAAVAAKKPALAQSPAPHAERRESPSTPVPVPIQELRVPTTMGEPGREERVKMSRLRQTIARRLKDAQNTAAMLTTFNDVDMSAVMALRSQYKDLFEKRHGVKLGFMGFFVKACVQALREIPAVNAEIDGEDIIYKNYYHIGVAVGTDRGLVVPVLREADRLSLAETEITIAEYGRRARDGKLSIEDMQGGTFTISNGGVYGSMLSTPILNAPQSGILGMHRIEERPVVKNGQIVARPMMYLALSYDHRVVDGKEAVTFLVRVKECLEDPQRFMLEL